MMRLSALQLLAGLLLLPLLAATGTALAEKVETTYDHRFDFSKVQNVAIEPFNRTDPATITVSDIQITRINDAIAEELKRKGFAVVKEVARADLLITWYLVSKDKTPGSSADRDARGILTVDMTDIMRNAPVWRSVLKTTLNAETDPVKLERERNIAAQAVFADFPPQ